MLTLRTFAPRLVPGAAVVTIASIAAMVGFPRRDAYTASKGAVIALSRAWAADLIRREVRVNCICPGVTDTPMTTRALGTDTSALPLGRLATPAEIAGVIASTLDPRASYLNGAIIPVDGGLTTTAGTVPLSPRTGAASGARP
jgi:3-oxoacyl-[acyl-carrier protein] reductase